MESKITLPCQCFSNPSQHKVEQIPAKNPQDLSDKTDPRSSAKFLISYN